VAHVTAPGAGHTPALLLRRGLLVIVAAALATGVLAGLGRLGVFIAWGPAYVVEHGPLLVLGAFGTVIALERAVALGRGWGLIAPGLGAATAIASLTGAPWAAWAAVGSALGMIILDAAIVRRQAAAFTWLMLLGATVLLIGNLAWTLGRPTFGVVPAWIGFFVITIVAERLELSRLSPTPRWAQLGLIVATSLLALTTSAHATVLLACPRGIGALLALLGAWQMRFDLARHTVRRPGLPRFAAAGVLGGAAWLVAAGVVLTCVGLPAAGPHYDAALHGVFVGFVFSMVFAHAPIILPAVARLAMPFTRWLYLPLATLHVGLVARVAGDLLDVASLRRGGGIANAVALALFALVAFARSLPRRFTSRP
jgi:hypothetical protein